MTYVYFVRMGNRWFHTTDEAQATASSQNRFRVQADDATNVQKWHEQSGMWLDVPALPAA